MIFKKSATVGSPEVSKLIHSAISKGQGDQRNIVFLRTKISHNGEKRFAMNTQNYHIIHIPLSYLTRMTQNKNASINAILQHGRVVNNNCYVVFPTSRFPCLIPDSENGRELPLTELYGQRTIKIFLSMKSLLLKPLQITRSNIDYCSH